MEDCCLYIAAAGTSGGGDGPRFPTQMHTTGFILLHVFFHSFQKAIHSHTIKCSFRQFSRKYMYISNVIQVSSQLHLDDLPGSNFPHGGTAKHLPMPADASLLQ